MTSPPYSLPCRVLLGVWLATPTAHAASIKGIVLGPDDLPMDDAIVAAFDPILDYVATTSRADGTYRINGLSPGLWRVAVYPPDNSESFLLFYPDATDFCAATTLLIASDDDELSDIDVTLRQGGSLTGRVINGEGLPVSDATVTATGDDAATAGWSGEGTTDSDGVFAIRGLTGDPVHGGSWMCEVEADGWPDQYFMDLEGTYESDEAETFSVYLTESTPTGTHMLRDGITVHGVVEGPDGPLADSTVHVYAASQIVSVSTDEDGAYDADGLPPGSVLPWASADGHAVTYYPDADRPDIFLSAPNEGDQLDDADIFAPAEATLPIRLTDQSGSTALPDVVVMLYNDTYTVGRGDSSDAQGLVTIDQLHPADYFLYVYGSDAGGADDWVRDGQGELAVFSIDGADSATTDIAVQDAATIQGIVTNADEVGISGVQITVTDVVEQMTHSTTSDTDGTWFVGGLPAGEYTLRAQYSPYCDQDPSYIPLYWADSSPPPGGLSAQIEDWGDGQINESWQSSVVLSSVSAEANIHFQMPTDRDRDGMGDEWESAWGLSVTNDDANDDPDADGYINRTEYLLGTNPLSASPSSGCITATPDFNPQHLGSWLLWMLGLLWTGAHRGVVRSPTKGHQT